ncbi:TonB-dependent siderophore receptor [Granulicella sp. S156]|uniref:TonB-dependent receptor plug domain-containing protein n=1 Tax=Granulicella sp. S156 TaxID=1747224 RepID=UPI00131D6E72|nr:TonB-dependent receptor [Granulicella sp. S156]
MFRLRHLPMLFVATLPLCAQQSQSPQTIPPVSTTVVVLGDVEPVSLGESARTVVPLDAQEHALASQDLEDYLRTDSSVDIQQRAGAGVMADISVRGASFEQTLVLLNGLRMDNVETSHFNLDLPVPLAALGKIDVLHGTGSTLYGSDAIGGVIDFMTFEPDATTLRIRAGAGSYGEDQEGLLGSMVGKRWSEVVAADRDRSTGFIYDRDYRTESASSETRFKSALGTSDLLFAGDDRAYGADQFYGNYPSWERTKGWFAALSQQFNEHTDAAVAYRRHSDIYVLLRDDPSYYKNQHIDDGFDGSVRDRREIFKNTTLLTGLEEDTDQIHSTNLGDHGRNRGAGYGDVEWRIAGKGLISAGLREEVFSGGRVVSSPTFAGTLWLPHSVKLRASAGYGFRLPTYLDLYYSDPTTLGNPNLKPESAWNYEGGADWFPSAHIAASVTAFYSQQKNTIDYTRASSNDLWQATNLPGLHFTGVESSLNWRPNSSQQLKLSWTLLKGTQSSLNGLQSEYVFDYPVNNGRVEWTWNLKHGLLLQSRLGVVERYTEAPAPPQAPYAVWDVSAVREVGRFRPYLQMTNLANTGYQEIANVRMQGRGFVGGVEFVLSRKR